MGRLTVCEAVVLSGVDYGEADRLVTLLTREAGRMTAFAAGARKSKRRFAGALEPGSYLRVRLTERGGGTHRLEGVDVLDPFHRMRGSLDGIARALHCVELCRELCREGVDHEPLFDALVAYLRLLDRGAAGPTSLLAFELMALELAGLRPRFDACARCGGAARGSPRFEPAAGGLVCEVCRPGGREGLPISAELAASFHRLQEGERRPWSDEARREGRALLDAFLLHHVGRPLRATAFLVRVGAA